MPSEGFLAALGVRVAEPHPAEVRVVPSDGVGGGVEGPSPATAQAGPVGPDVGAFVAAECCCGPRVWCEPHRLHYAYLRWGGALDDAQAFLATLSARRGGRGLVLGLGLRGEWGPKDGGTRRRRTD